MKTLGMVVENGEFSEVVYLFGFSFWDAVWENAANDFMDFRERQGIFGPGTVDPAVLEYGGWADIMDDLENDWSVEGAGQAAADDD